MMTILVTSQILLWLGFIAMVIAFIALARQVGVLFERVAPVGALTPNAGPSVGGAAPQFNLPALTGQHVTIGGRLAPGGNQLLLFISSKCPICKSLIPVAKSVARSEAIALVFAGDADEGEQLALVERYELDDYPFLNSAELGQAFAVEKLPHAVLMNDQGLIVAKGLVNSREHLESLMVARDMNVSSVQQYLQSRRT